jgi:hypothetical protein
MKGKDLNLCDAYVPKQRFLEIVIQPQKKNKVR